MIRIISKDILLLIFSQLSPRELRSCCCVCTEWSNLVSSNSMLSSKKNGVDVYRAIVKKSHFQCWHGWGDTYVSDPLIAPNQKDILILDHNTLQIMVFNRDGGNPHTLVELFKMTISPRDLMVGGGTVRHGICIVQSRIFIIDNHDQKILILDQDYKLIKTCSTGPFTPRLVCPFRMGSILVATDDSFLLLYDLDGHLITTIQPQLPVGEGVQEWRSLCIDSRERIIFGDYIRCEVRIQTGMVNFYILFFVEASI